MYIKTDIQNFRFQDITSNSLTNYKTILASSSIDHTDPRVKEDALRKAVDLAVKDFINQTSLNKRWEHVGQQLLAHLASYKLPSRTNIDPKAFYDLNVTNDRERGIWLMLTKIPRGRLMTKQTSKEHLPVCGLVPLYMAAQKQYNGIPYSSWSRENLHYIVDKELAEAMSAPRVNISPNDLLELRSIGLYQKDPKTGKKVHRNPATYHALVGLSDTPLGPLSGYAKAMLCQIWCAHPTNRHKYMILDPYDWDNIPEPLINTEPLQTTTDSAIPWESI